MQGDEILGIIRRITRDFAPILPGLRLEVVSPEGFRARVRGKPIVADEAMLRAVLGEERGGAGRSGARARERAALGGAPGGGRTSGEGGNAGAPRASGKVRTGTKAGDAARIGGVPGGETRGVSDRTGPGAEGGKREKAGEERSREGAAERYPLYALPTSRTIMVEMKSLSERINREDHRLHRPLVEGLVLREVLYLITSGQPLPDPRARAERILRRHWPFQYAALRSVGLTVTGFERPQTRPEMARDN